MTRYGGILGALAEAVDIRPSMIAPRKRPMRSSGSALRRDCGSTTNFRKRLRKATSFRFDGSTDGLA